MKKIKYLIHCYPGFKYLTPARQAYYAAILPLEHLFQEYQTQSTSIVEQDIEDISYDALLLLTFQHRKKLRNAFKHFHIFHMLNQEIVLPETRALLKRYFFGLKLLSNHTQIFLAASEEFQRVKSYIQKLYNNLEEKYIRMIEENNTHHGCFSECRRIPSDKILLDYENDRMHLQMKIRIGVQYFLQIQEKQLPKTNFTSHVKRLNQSIRHHYATRVNQLFRYFPALMKINVKYHNRLYPHFVTLLLESSREIFNETSNKKKKNDLIIRCIAMECYYILDEFTTSFGYSIDLQEINRKHALEMAETIYQAFLKKAPQNDLLNDFIKNYKSALVENILHIRKNQGFSFLYKYDNQLSYTYTEHATQSLNHMWSYTISSQPARIASRFITRFLDAFGVLQTMNLSTENDIALFFVATHATRMSEEVSTVKSILFAIARMVFGTIRHELYEASREPNPKVREFKLAAIILFYTAMIALCAIALSFTTFMALFVGFEFIAIPVAIIIVIAAATLATKATFYLIHAYQEWKHNSINQRMQDALGSSLAKEILTLYKNALKSVDIMLLHLDEKTGLIRRELDFKVELEKLKIDLKKEWKYIRDDKTYPIDEVKKLIKNRVKYFYEKEKCKFQGRLHNEVVQRFEVQQEGFLRFCEKSTSPPFYKNYLQNKNELVFFKQRIKKLKNISDRLEENDEKAKRILLV